MKTHVWPDDDETFELFISFFSFSRVCFALSSRELASPFDDRPIESFACCSAGATETGATKQNDVNLAVVVSV